MYRQRTIGEVSRQAPHRSLFWSRLEQWAGTTPVVVWLVEKTNLRGWFGATSLVVPHRPARAELSNERLVVGLLMPQGPLDVRLFKLALRIIQSGKLSARTLWLEARKERAAATLFWLLALVPKEERTAEVTGVVEEQRTAPRGYRPLPIVYDAARLIRRPATRESVWRAARR